MFAAQLYVSMGSHCNSEYMQLGQGDSESKKTLTIRESAKSSWTVTVNQVTVTEMRITQAMTA